jgi:hypothetical protein
MLLVGLGRTCGLARTVPPLSVGGARKSFHAARFSRGGGITANVSGACVRLKCEHDINLKHETKAREGVTQHFIKWT